MTNPLNFKDIHKDRYKYFKTYKVDRWIIQSCMILVFAFLFFVAYRQNFDLDYYSCVSPGWGSQEAMFINATPLLDCENPFYEPVTWKNRERLAPGEYGKKPDFLFNSIWLVTIGIFILGFVLNHFIHNRKKEVVSNERSNDSINK